MGAKLSAAAGVFLFVIGAMLMAVTQTGISGTAARVITGFGSLASVFLEMSVVILVWQGNQKDYYQYMTTIGEHYLQAELRHFRAYQERETRVRKIRHDMRNHLLCLRELAENGKTEQIKEYLGELSGALRETEQTVYSGNEIADAIINEKEVLARAEKEVVPPGSTRKEDPENHGFGILNMTYAAKKYQGSVQRRIETAKGTRVYSTEILLLLPEKAREA